MSNDHNGRALIAEVMQAIGDRYRRPARKPTQNKAAPPLSGPTATRFVGTYLIKDFRSKRFSIMRSDEGEPIGARAAQSAPRSCPSGTPSSSRESAMTIEGLRPAKREPLH